MTQEDKDLLLKDLCGRLPYGVIVAYKSQEKEGRVKLGYGNIGYVAELGRSWWIECKPYLRPMSSMTRAEVLEYISLKESIVASDGITYFFETYKSIDWLNKKMFDYRKDDEDKTMIEKGLALEAPEGMYK